jgi:hypothetical protein
MGCAMAQPIVISHNVIQTGAVPYGIGSSA